MSVHWDLIRALKDYQTESGCMVQFVLVEGGLQDQWAVIYAWNAECAGPLTGKPIVRYPDSRFFSDWEQFHLVDRVQPSSALQWGPVFKLTDLALRAA